MPVVKEVKIRQRCGIRNTDLWDTKGDRGNDQRPSVHTAKTSHLNGLFSQWEGKKIALKIVLSDAFVF